MEVVGRYVTFLGTRTYCYLSSENSVNIVNIIDGVYQGPYTYVFPLNLKTFLVSCRKE